MSIHLSASTLFANPHQYFLIRLPVHQSILPPVHLCLPVHGKSPIHPSTCPVHQSTFLHAPIHQATHSLIHQSIHPPVSVYQSINRPCHLSINSSTLTCPPSNCLPIYPSAYSPIFIHQSTPYLSTSPFYPSTYQSTSTHPTVHQSTHPSVHQTHPPTHSSTCPPHLSTNPFFYPSTYSRVHHLSTFHPSTCPPVHHVSFPIRHSTVHDPSAVICMCRAIRHLSSPPL